MKKKSTIALFGIMAIMQIAPLQTNAGQQIKKDNFAALCKINDSPESKLSYNKGVKLGEKLKQAEDEKDFTQERQIRHRIDLMRNLYMLIDIGTASVNNTQGYFQRISNSRDERDFLDGIKDGYKKIYNTDYKWGWYQIGGGGGWGDLPRFVPQCFL